MPTNGFCTKPLKVKLLAGEQKATEVIYPGVLLESVQSHASHQLVFGIGALPRFDFQVVAQPSLLGVSRRLVREVLVL